MLSQTQSVKTQGNPYNDFGKTIGSVLNMVKFMRITISYEVLHREERKAGWLDFFFNRHSFDFTCKEQAQASTSTGLIIFFLLDEKRTSESKRKPARC